MSKYKILADLHTHSIFSKHAFSSISENIEYAKLLGLKYLAISDHVFQAGSDSEIKNEAIRFQYLEKEVNYKNSLYILGGAEFNLFQNLKFKEKFENISWRIIGLHKFTEVNLKYISLQKVYQEFKKYSGFVNGFAHIERELQDLENGRYHESLSKPIMSFLSSVVELAKENDIYLEANESSLRNYDNLYRERMVYWLTRAKELKCNIYLGSDAHYCKRIGNFDNSLALLKELNYPEELILNFNEDRIKKLIHK